MSLKTKIIGAVIAIGLILIAIFKVGLGGNPISLLNNPSSSGDQSNVGPELISSNPPELFLKKPLIFTPDKVIELNFNAELENGPETKITIDPPAEVQIDVINGNKTARITPLKPYKLGQGYTLMIKPETKIKGGKTLGRDYSLQFNVINYSGI